MLELRWLPAQPADNRASLDGVGGQAYLERVAKQNPAAFLTLLGNVLPLQVQGPRADGAHCVTFVVEGVPPPRRLNEPDGNGGGGKPL